MTKDIHRRSVPEVLVFVLDDGVFIHLAKVGDLAHAQDQDFARQLVGNGGSHLQVLVHHL